MAEEKSLKKIGTIFGDFKCDTNILNAKIATVNLYKKKNCFEVFLLSDKIIKINEIYAFEKFLIKRFALSSAIVKVKYDESIEDKNINIINEWENIVDYLSYRYPMTKAILKNSQVQIDENNINVKLHMAGKEFLIARGMNKIFEETLENIYNRKFKINFIDEMSNEEKSHYKELTKSLEGEAINEVSKQLEKQHKKEEKEQKKDSENVEQQGHQHF